MEVSTFNIADVFLFKPKVFGDDRGYFFESFNQDKFEEILGRKINFIQDNESKSSYGVLRGLHFQKPPFEQAKLVRVIEGEVLDVAVDLRSKSPTFGNYISAKLSGKNKHQLFVPRGFAHGFVVLSDYAIFSYKVDNKYAPSHDSGIIYDDSSLNIDWTMNTSDINLSEKDRQQQSFQNYINYPIF
jgi:dTDP-4-dehydrorhamnose 3,5-epimerase